ncbi:MAG: MetQ/NlpA family ABC transporter substrate-binding protein [Oscillospiraceae bacterium]
MYYKLKKLLTLGVALSLSTALVACASTADTTIKSNVLNVGASPSPHAEILQVIKPILAEKGIELIIKEFSDYVLPNRALDEGSLDANFFQHQPYLDDFNKNNNTKIIAAAPVHFEPLGIYAGKSSDLNNIQKGAKIAVPNDTSNEARALQLLEHNGILKLDPKAGLSATVKDIIENPYEVKIVEIEAAQVPRTLEDVDFAVINGNYALLAKVTDKILLTESSDSNGAIEFANILAIRQGDENRPEIQALVEALTSETVRTFIIEQYGVSVVPVF